jgi:hypothetical protein
LSSRTNISCPDTAWERLPVSELAKKSIWRVEGERYALTMPSVYDLGRQLPEYYGPGVDPDRMTHDILERLRREAREKFLHTDMFFVKVHSSPLVDVFGNNFLTLKTALGPLVHRSHDTPPPRLTTLS